MTDDSKKFWLQKFSGSTELVSMPGNRVRSRLTQEVFSKALAIAKNDESVAWQYYVQAQAAEEDSRFDHAIAMYLVAAQLGYVLAQRRLGEMYLDGVGTPVDLASSFNWFHRAASQGDVESQLRVGWAYESGSGVDRDQRKAVYWYRTAAESGSIEAQFRLGVKYDNGEGVGQNSEEAFRWFFMSGERGHNDARYFLALALESGEGVEPDLEEAIDWHYLAAEGGQKSAKRRVWEFAESEDLVPDNDEMSIFLEHLGAELGHAQTQMKLGYRYAVGKGVRKDVHRALNLISDSTANGSFDAYLFLGTFYKFGVAVEADEELADDLYEKYYEEEDDHWPGWLYRDFNLHSQGVIEGWSDHFKADAGDLDACEKIGWNSHKGINGWREDDELAFKYFLAPATAGRKWAQSIIGWLYKNGPTTIKDPVKGVEWLERSRTNETSSYESAHTYSELAQSYRYGVGASPDFLKAREYFQRGGELGSGWCCYQAAQMFRNGLGGAADMEEAIKWYEKSIEDNSYKFGFYGYGKLLVEELGGDSETRRGLQLLRRGAELGSVECCEFLAEVYEDGGIRQRNRKTAEKWRNMAKDISARDNVVQDQMQLGSSGRSERLQEKRSRAQD